MDLLEDIARRRNYKLKIDWSCRKCGGPTTILGKLFKNEPGYKEKDEFRKPSKLNWEDILHKECSKCNLVERPDRKCDTCGENYDFDEVMCRKCNKHIEEIIDVEKEYFNKLEEIRVKKQKKQNVDKDQREIEQIINKLFCMGAYPCVRCLKVWGTYEGFLCKPCERKLEDKIGGP